MNTAIATKPMRGAYQGVAQMVRFNRRMYLAAAIGMLAAVAAWPLSPAAVRLFRPNPHGAESWPRSRCLRGRCFSCTHSLSGWA